jgi:uncharacterized protein (DUF1697 family)
VPRYVALLRSVNVAGHGRLSMDELRQSFSRLGYEDVTTYIQTGNVLFTAPSRQVRVVVASIEEQLERDVGRSPAVLVRTVAQLRRISTSSPFAARGADPARHHVTFLAAPPSAEALAELELPPSGRDELVVDGTEVYVHTPGGYAGTKYSGAFLERRLGVLSTTRNWNTVTKLCALAAKG